MPRFAVRNFTQCLAALGPTDNPELLAALGSTDDPDVAASAGEAPTLFKLLSKPKRGDWLADKEELGQTYAQYSKRYDPKKGMSLPRAACDGLLVCPIGASFASEVGAKFLPHLVAYCTAFFPGMSVEVLEKPVSLKTISSRENDFGHKQYLISDIFDFLNTDRGITAKRRAFCRLAVTLEDIYPGDEWNYVFGQARPMERVGVFSFARHSPVFYDGVHGIDAPSRLNGSQLLSWMRTNMHTMVHETCHMLGILHCVFWNCLMNGSNGPHDSTGSAFLCPVCLRKLLYALSILQGPPSVEVIDARYAHMEAAKLAWRDAMLAEDEGSRCGSLQRDLDWLQQRRAQLEELRRAPPPPAPHTEDRPQPARPPRPADAAVARPESRAALPGSAGMRGRPSGSPAPAVAARTTSVGVRTSRSPSIPKSRTASPKPGSATKANLPAVQPMREGLRVL